MDRNAETYLWERMKVADGDGLWPSEIIREMVDTGLIRSSKQAYATLEKWNRKNWITYGGSISGAWKQFAGPLPKSSLEADEYPRLT